MPTIVWVMAGAGVWLAAVSATCALLTVAKRADAAAGAGGDARRPGCRALPENALGGPGDPAISAIVVALGAPALAGRMHAIAPGGPDPRRLRRPPGSVEVDRAS